MAAKPGRALRLYQSIGAVRTGIIILLIVGIVSAAGTVILQRPLTSPEDMERAYSPQVLRILDGTGLTDVYHVWWYLALLALLAISIICASIERWPNAWKFYSRPYRRTDAAFRVTLPLRRSFPVDEAAQALDTVESVWKRHGLKPERTVEREEVALYAEKSRYAVLAVYVVHASLLLIMLGGVTDSIWGYKGYVALIPGAPAITEIELRDNTVHRLPFALRCDDAGQENYTGQFSMMPKRWWSKLTVLENGREIEHKEIAVNDPLVYRGVRFYQSGYGTSAELRKARLAVLTAQDTQTPEAFKLTANQSVQLRDGATVTMIKFISDAFPMDRDLYQRSKELGNAAIKLEVTRDGQTQPVFLFRTEEAAPGDLTLTGPYDAQGNAVSDMPYRFLASLDLAPFTGLQVSHEPGEWIVWAGCLLMATGLVLSFWVLHQRYWAVAVHDKEGRLVLWLGAASNKKRETFEARFQEMASEIETELKKPGESAPATGARPE
jgi:cytochrome c biogenesis protein